jgi:hypothetical protein
LRDQAGLKRSPCFQLVQIQAASRILMRRIAMEKILDWSGEEPEIDESRIVKPRIEADPGFTVILSSLN